MKYQWNLGGFFKNLENIFVILYRIKVYEKLGQVWKLWPKCVCVGGGGTCPAILNHTANYSNRKHIYWLRINKGDQKESLKQIYMLTTIYYTWSMTKVAPQFRGRKNCLLVGCAGKTGLLYVEIIMDPSLYHIQR